MARYPLQVRAFLDALRLLPGVRDLHCYIRSVSGLDAAAMSSAEFANIPHAAYRRTNGGLPREALIQVDFEVDRSSAGWRALEFIAWWVRDCARGGELIQFCPFAL